MPKKSKGKAKKKASVGKIDTVNIHASQPVSTSVQSKEASKALPSEITPSPMEGNVEESKKVARNGAVDLKQEIKVGPLTPEELKETRAVKAAYASFWENLKFKKGWDTPLFFQSEIDDLLGQAAEIVARIRVHLDDRDPGFKMRMVEGNAHEFFWSQHEHPRTHPDAFVRELVHQTLKDANGYVEGLTKEAVDGFVDRLVAYAREEDGSSVLQGEVQLLRAKTKRQWQGLSTLWNGTFEQAAPNVEPSACTVVQLAAYRELGRALDRVQYYVQMIQEEQAKQREAASQSQQAAADAKERFQEQSLKRKQLKELLRSQLNSATSDDVVEAPSEPASGEADQPKVEVPSSPPVPSGPLKSPTRVPSSLASPKRAASQGEEEDPEDPPAIKKIEELVKEVNVRKSELDRMKDRTQNLEIQELNSNPMQSQKTVKSLHERCKFLSLELERDLLKLDAIVGGSKVRPLRKAQVRNIQHMLEDVDSINEKLSGLETSLLPAVEEEQQRLAEQKAQEEAEAARIKQEEEALRQEEQKKRKEQERELEAQRARERGTLAERWKLLKLHPKFDVKELRTGYQISAYIPGMQKEDLDIEHSGNTLVLSGVRLPSREEEESMGQLLRARGQAVDDQNLLRLGAGRFGRFQQQYSLPGDVDTSGVKATYEAGVFQVTIPRKHRPSRSFPGGGGFFNDSDFWW